MKPSTATNFRGEVCLGRIVTFGHNDEVSYCSASYMPGVDLLDPQVIADKVNKGKSHIIIVSYADGHGQRTTRHGFMWVDDDGHLCVSRKAEWWRFLKSDDGRVATESGCAPIQ